MSTYTYPHTIENGESGERLTFLRRIEDGAGDRLEVENIVKPGFGPPLHVHHHQSESLTVVEGRVGYELQGKEPQFAGPGESITFEAGQVHRFWNAGETDLRCTGHIEPADNIEYFLGAIYDSQRESGSERPGLFDAAFLMRRFRNEFAMAEIPAPVQRFVFPLIEGLGRIMGKYGKYADAPAPVSR